MEFGEPNTSRRSIVPIAQIIGVLVGLLLTGGINWLAPALVTGDMSGSGLLALWLWALVMWPAGTMCQLVGWKWQIDIGRGPSWTQILLAAVVNALLLYLFGTLLGWLVKKKRERKKAGFAT